MLDQLLIPTWYFAIFNLYGEILSWLFQELKVKPITTLVTKKNWISCGQLRLCNKSFAHYGYLGLNFLQSLLTSSVFLVW